MKVVTHTHKYESREEALFKPIPFGDVHRGSRGMDEKLFYKTLEYAKETKAPLILMGDYGEFISKDDRRHDYAGIRFDMLTPDRQYKKIRDDFMEVKDQIVCVLAGNHEYSYWMHNDIDWANWLAAELGGALLP